MPNISLARTRRRSDARITLNDVEERMEKAVDFLKEQLHGITQLGANNASLVDSVKVDYYGQPTPIKHIAYSSCDKLRVSITPHEEKFVSEIVKACERAGFNAYKFSKEIAMVTLPIPSGETKKEMKKRIKSLGEETKISIRNIRKKFKQSSEDNSEEKALQKITNAATQAVDEIVKRKTAYVT